MNTVDMLVELNRRLQPGHPVHRAPRAGRLPARANAGLEAGLLPRQRLAAGADSAASGNRRALRVRLPDSAYGGCQSAGWSGRTGARLHRPACLGRSLSSRRRLDRFRRHLWADGGRGPHPRRLHRGAGERGTGVRLHRRVRDAVRVRDEGDAHSRGPARNQTLQRRAVERDRHPRPSGGNRARPGRRAPDHGRRADVRLHRRYGRPASGTTPPWARTSENLPENCCSGSSKDSRRVRCCTTARASGIRASRCRAGH